MPPTAANTTEKAKLAGTRKADRADLEQAIHRIDFADLWRGQGTEIAKHGDVRIVIRGPWTEDRETGGKVIHAQTGFGPIAAIRLSGAFKAADRGQHRLVVFEVGEALTGSWKDRTWYHVIEQ